MSKPVFKLTPILLAWALLGVSQAASAGDWPHWRGPQRNGQAGERGILSDWSEPTGEILWRQDFVGRSTPLVFDGRVCANGRVGEEKLRQETVACFDAKSGEKLWQHSFNVYHTTVPWTRVGWASPALDTETGYLYVQGVGGMFLCLDSKTGEVIWEHNLVEKYGFMEGYGGRTQSPLVDEDRVIVSFASTNWGPTARPLTRFHAFDKRTGELIWMTTPGNESLADKNIQSTPQVAVINGQRLIVQGAGNGRIYAVQSRTGKTMWGYHLSKRGINSSPLVDGSTVYVSHSEENVDSPDMGRTVSLDGSASGTLDASAEQWRSPLGFGFGSATVDDKRIYLLNNSAGLHAIDKKTGELAWELNVGRVGKATPILLDGQLVVTEVNGRLIFVKLGEEEGEILGVREFYIEEEERFAEIYGSVAVGYGRLYVTTEEGIYAIGSPEEPFEVSTSAALELADEATTGSSAAQLVVRPAMVDLHPGDEMTFEVTAYDDNGRSLGAAEGVTWSLEGLQGTVDTNGKLKLSSDSGAHVGNLVAKAGELTINARARVTTPVPFTEDFSTAEVGKRPAHQLGYVARFAVEELDGEKVLAKGPSPIKIHRHITFLGSSDNADYTIEGEIMGTKTGRKVPDAGLINSGYIFEFLGGHQKLELRSWNAALRMAVQEPFTWQPDVWYKMKLKVSTTEESALVQGKIWPRDEPEPDAWTIETEDPRPIRSGAAGLAGYSPTPIYFDNIRVMRNP